MNLDIEKHTIFKALTGSRAYGLATPESDYDYRGVAIPSKPYFFGFADSFEQYPTKDDKEERDIIIYDVRKFFRLAMQCNPNVLELLWAPERCILVLTALGELLLAHRNIFLSTKVKETFSGYAFDQLKRIKTHRRWLLNPPREKPSREKYGLPKVSNFSNVAKTILKAVESAEEVSIEEILHPEMVEIWRKERIFLEAQRDWENYQNWLKSRNPKRAELEAKWGYDTKHAMHLVRIMRMCEEILNTGEIIVERPDRAELIAIRDGSWSYDRLIEWAQDQDQELTKLYDSCIILPRAPDIKKLDALCVELVEGFLRWHTLPAE